MSFRSEALHATGHKALDEHGAKVGKITDVLFDEEGRPKWAVVDPGPFRKAHYAPMDGAYETAGGDIVLPVSDDAVMDAPTADRSHVLTPELEEELETFYR